jgi:hypothetical protein
VKIDLVAKLKKTEDFIATYQEGDEKASYGGRSLIFWALGNSDLRSRYEISEMLLNKNVDVLSKNSDSDTVLHVLLGQAKNDVSKVYDLCREFIKRGVDINAKDRLGQTAIYSIIRMKNTDEELQSLYDLFFATPDLDLSVKDKAGVTPLRYASSCSYRTALAERMRNYERNQNI